MNSDPVSIFFGRSTRTDLSGRSIGTFALGRMDDTGDRVPVDRGIFDDCHEHPFVLWLQPVSHYIDRPEPVLPKKMNRYAKRFARIRYGVFVRDGFACRDCDRQFDHPEPYKGQGIEGLTLGHIIPRSKGGRQTVSNLVAQCECCNKELGDREWVEGWRS